MNVYIVGATDYDYHNLYGIFDSLEAAHEYISKNFELTTEGSWTDSWGWIYINMVEINNAEKFIRQPLPEK